MEETPLQMSPAMEALKGTLGTPVEGDVRPKQRVRLFGNATDPVPFRLKPGQSIPDVKGTDTAANKPKEVWEAKANVFHLTNADELEVYNAVVKMVGEGRAMISREEVNWSDKDGNYVVYFRWVELYMELPRQ